MTGDDNPWYSDSNSGPTPPTVPDGSGFPTPPPTPVQHPQPPDSGAPQYGQPRPQGQPPPYPGYQPYGYQSYGQPAFGTQAVSHGKATTAMVLGIIGLVGIVACYAVPSLVLSPLSFFLGRSAQKEIESNPGAWSNAGMARAGWIMGLIGTILALLAAAVVGAFFLWLASTDDFS